MAFKKPDLERCAGAASVLKSMAHPQRLFILCRLYQDESTVSDLERITPASQPVISQHLTRMRREGIVDSRREGNFVYYRVVDDRVRLLINALESLYGL